MDIQVGQCLPEHSAGNATHISDTTHNQNQCKAARPFKWSTCSLEVLAKAECVQKKPNDSFPIMSWPLKFMQNRKHRPHPQSASWKPHVPTEPHCTRSNQKQHDQLFMPIGHKCYVKSRAIHINKNARNIKYPYT